MLCSIPLFILSYHKTRKHYYTKGIRINECLFHQKLVICRYNILIGMLLRRKDILFKCGGWKGKIGVLIQGRVIYYLFLFLA